MLLNLKGMATKYTHSQELTINSHIFQERPAKELNLVALNKRLK
jgi:hypothetical protein